MIPVIQPFHILVLALTGWLNRHCDVKSSILLL